MQKLSEKEFLVLIEKKAKEEKKIVETEIMPGWARGVGEWLVVNPWRVLAPLSVVLYIAIRMLGGVVIRELILGLFGGY